MHIALISRDDGLKRLCREALATLPARAWNLLVADPDDAPPAADVFIWDSDLQTPLPHLLERRRPAAHVLAISREQAARILDVLPFSTVTLVLKPVHLDTLRTLLEQAANHYESLQGANGLGRMGSLRQDRDAMLDCLLATTLRLQECDQDRMNFLARAVHDFRTPLTAVNGYCGLLLSEQFGPITAAQQEVLERTLHSVRRLSRLAAALFQWSSEMHVGLRPQIRQADIQECCRQAIHEVKPFAGEKSISIELDLQAPEQPLCFDSTQVEQLLINLLENSCKFTPRGGHMQIRGFPAFWDRRSASVSQDRVLIERRCAPSRRANVYRMEVTDNGMGVHPEHLRTIFQEHTSYGGGSDRSGSGLGLAICKRILGEHGGEIFAESGNQGVTFIFMLPFTPPVSTESFELDDVQRHLVTDFAGRVNP
ncbi:MAG: HAMP domain-containing sensor histidine kinase [Bryobacteraceae bacterium]